MRLASTLNPILQKLSEGKLSLAIKFLDSQKPSLLLKLPWNSTKVSTSKTNLKKLRATTPITKDIWQQWRKEILRKPFPVSIISATKFPIVKNSKSLKLNALPKQEIPLRPSLFANPSELDLTSVVLISGISKELLNSMGVNREEPRNISQKA